MEKDYAHKYWRCRSCQQMVDLDAFRCGCATSPSPWEPVAAPEKPKGKDPIASLIGWLFLALVCWPGLWLSYPLLKMGALEPKGGKRTLGELIYFVITTLIGSLLFWIAVAVAMAYFNVSFKG